MLLAGDQSTLRAWVRLALAQTELRVAGEAAGAEETARLATELEPGVLLLETTGLELLGVTAPESM